MKIDEIFTKRRKNWDRLTKMRRPDQEKTAVCPHCGRELTEAELDSSLYLCPGCRTCLTMPPAVRIQKLCDTGSFREMFPQLTGVDPLRFPGYEEKLKKNREATGEMDACIGGVGKIYGRKVVIGILDGRFLMGSMGTAVGEKITRLTEYAGKKKLPLILFSASGGARMQEGLFSLMQMAKTSAAVEKFRQEGGLYVSVLTDPTTGGVSASFASLGDIILAEPGALICFAGPRVIQQTIGQTLPEGFQRAEFLLEHGMIDGILERKHMKSTLGAILRIHSAGDAARLG